MLYLTITISVLFTGTQAPNKPSIYQENPFQDTYRLQLPLWVSQYQRVWYSLGIWTESIFCVTFLRKLIILAAR